MNKNKSEKKHVSTIAPKAEVEPMKTYPPRAYVPMEDGSIATGTSVAEALGLTKVPPAELAALERRADEELAKFRSTTGRHPATKLAQAAHDATRDAFPALSLPPWAEMSALNRAKAQQTVEYLAGNPQGELAEAYMPWLDAVARRFFALDVISRLGR